MLANWINTHLLSASALVSVICQLLALPDIRRDRQTHSIITYVDIKTPSLRDILRCILKGVKTARLEGDKPAVQLLMVALYWFSH
jgi:hypothetical protein